MHPVLLKFGSVTIYTYGFMIALGFLLGIVLAMREARRLGENPEKIMDISFYILVAAIIGSRLFYVGNLHWPAFNVADSAITVGVAIFIAHLLFRKLPE